MANTDKIQNAPVQKWKGYSMDELKFQKAVTVVKIDMKKQAIANEFNSLPQKMTNSLVERFKATFVGKAFGIVAKFLKR